MSQRGPRPWIGQTKGSGVSWRSKSVKVADAESDSLSGIWLDDNGIQDYCFNLR